MISRAEHPCQWGQGWDMGAARRGLSLLYKPHFPFMPGRRRQENLRAAAPVAPASRSHLPLSIGNQREKSPGASGWGREATKGVCAEGLPRPGAPASPSGDPGPAATDTPMSPSAGRGQPGGAAVPDTDLESRRIQGRRRDRPESCCPQLKHRGVFSGGQ